MEKLRESRQSWLGHVMRRGDAKTVISAIKMNVDGKRKNLRKDG